MGEQEEEGNGEGGINALLYSPSTCCTVPANQIISLLFSDRLFINNAGLYRAGEASATGFPHGEPLTWIKTSAHLRYLATKTPSWCHRRADGVYYTVLEGCLD